MGYSVILVAAVAISIVIFSVTSLAAQQDSPLYKALQAEKPLAQIIREELPTQSHERRAELKNYLLSVHWPQSACDAIFDVLGTTDRLDVIHWIIDTLAARQPVQGQDEAHIDEAMVKFALRRRLPYEDESQVTRIAREAVTDLIVQKRLPVLEKVQLRVIAGDPDAPILLARLAGATGSDIAPFSQWLANAPDPRMRETADKLAPMIPWPGRTDQQIRKILSDLAEGPAKSYYLLHNIGLPFDGLPPSWAAWTEQQREADPAAYARWIEFLASLIMHESDRASMSAAWLLNSAGELSGTRRTDALARAYAIIDRGVPQEPHDQLRAAVAAVIARAETDRSKLTKLVPQVLDRNLPLAASLVALLPAKEVSDETLRMLVLREPKGSVDHSFFLVRRGHRDRVAPIILSFLVSDSEETQLRGIHAAYSLSSMPSVQAGLLSLVERLPLHSPNRIEGLRVLTYSRSTDPRIRSLIEELVAAQRPSSPNLDGVVSLVLGANEYHNSEPWVGEMISSICADLNHPLRAKMIHRHSPAQVVELPPVEVARHLATVRQTAGTNTEARREALGALYGITNPPSEVVDVLILTLVNPQLAVPRPPDPILPEESQRWFRSRRFDEPRYKQAREALQAWQRHRDDAIVGGLGLRHYVHDDPSVLERIERLLGDHPHALAWALIGLSEMPKHDVTREVTDLPLTMIAKARDPLLAIAALPASDFIVSRRVPDIATELLSRLGATDSQVRKALRDAALFGREMTPRSAVISLARIHPVPSEAHEAISYALSSRSSSLVHAGAEAVGMMGDAEGRYTSTLIAIANQQPFARYAAAKALQKTAPNHPEVKRIIDEIERQTIPFGR